MNLVTVPFFALPGLVLFPRTLLPLHIFEPRYIRLVRDVIEGNRRVAVGSLKPGWEPEYFDAPKSHRIVTVARLLHEERLAHGRFNILLEGVERAVIREEPESKPYRRVRVEPLADVMPVDSRPQVQAATSELVALAEELAREREPLRAALTNLENVHLHPGIIADQVASLIVKDPYERQSLLEEREVCRRVRLVCVQLRRALSRTDGSASPTESGLE